MKSASPIRLGLAGLGGYAGYICDRILEDAASTNTSAHLVAVCDPALERFGARVRQLEERGIKAVKTFDQLLAMDIEAVWLPLPIDLHRPFTEAALKAGKAVMCEKPAAGSVDDVDAMIAARDRANVPVAIGFQDIYQPLVAQLKQRMVAGDFGRPVAATVFGCWPRSERYFGRNDWAGRFKRDGRWVMDSPATNALAHFINLSMFLLGPAPQSSASPTYVAAELYRANRIDNFDTCSMRITLAGDVPLYIAYTHACNTNCDPIITIECEKSTLHYVAGRHVEIRTGTAVEVLPLLSHPHPYILRAFHSWMRNGVDSSIGATLEMAREHVVAMNVASETSPIHDIPGDYIDILQGPDHAPLRSIREIIPAMHACASRKCMLHETKLAGWSVEAHSHAIPRNYSHFAGPKTPRVSVTTHAPSSRRPATSATH
jgi:predicted dehydrogenase